MAIASAIRVDRERFEQDGYLVIEDVFDPMADLDPVVHEYARQLDEVAADWHARGLIDSTYADLPFSERFGHVLNDAGPDGYRPFDITLSGPITTDSPMHTGPAVFNLITHPRLLDVVEQLIGPEILSNPIQHVRIKPPEHLLNQKFQGKNTMFSATEWHQDQGVATVLVDQTEMLTVWFPVLDATIENGCLCVIPESHTRGLLLHCPSKPGQIFDLRIPEVIRGAGGIPVEMKRGSALFMHRLTMHSSLRNLSQRCAGASTCATNRSARRRDATGCQRSSRAARPIRVRNPRLARSGPTCGGKRRAYVAANPERPTTAPLDRHRNGVRLKLTP